MHIGECEEIWGKEKKRKRKEKKFEKKRNLGKI